MFAMIGILLALEVRNRSGEGQLVDVSMLDSMISAMASNFANFAGSGVVPGAMGTRFGTIVPYRGFPTADRDIVIAVASTKLWPEFCRAVDRVEWIDHPDYSTNPLRVKNREMLEGMIADLFKTAPSAVWIERLGARGVPCAPVRTLDEVTSDPQAKVREMFPEIDGFQVTGPPVKLSATPGRIPWGAPQLGEHTLAALVELLDLEPEAIDGLIERGVIQISVRP
jgi:crotonobetainyl-CoA:carnitine CoA-transferase CaiB-like acyl-CoA transferase